jgi:nucleoside-diphosphate-sugar epimerase
MRIFLTGASGYIGGSVAAALLAAGHEVAGLARSAERARQVEALGIEPVLGELGNAGALAHAARAADAVIHAASSDDRGSVEAMLPALEASGKLFLQTSGSSIVADQAGGEPGDKVYQDDTPFTPGPGRAARVAINELVRASAARGVRAVVIAPALIYGEGRGLHRQSIQVPALERVARRSGVARHVGRGENLWSNVHIDDLADLYLRILERAPAGAFYYAENGECSMRALCAAISLGLGYGGRTEPMSLAEAIAEWGDGAANYTYGSNSRVRAVRARRELGWAPRGPALLDSIARGGA